jgi:threonine/homoserine/homoserine lactone efflux protein
MPFDFSTYALFCLGAMALIMSPGPDFFYVATRGLAGGRSAGVVSALGIGAGLAVHTVLAASGLTLLLLASDTLFNIVKWIGAAYLIWIGIKLLRAGDEFLTPTTKSTLRLPQVFRQGVLTNVFNPKSPSLLRRFCRHLFMRSAVMPACKSRFLVPRSVC